MSMQISTTYDMEDMLIKFDGQTHQIEANTLINSLLHFTNVVHEINRELGEDQKVTINIKAHQEGSFEVLLNLIKDVTEASQTLFPAVISTNVSLLINTVSGVYNAYKFLKGDKPKTIESTEGGVVKIENVSGDVTYIDNRIFNIIQGNQIVRNNLAQGFDTLDKDVNVTGFEFLKENQSLLNIQREEFQSLAAGGDNGELQKDERLLTIGQAMLRIVRLSFDPKMKSDFLYEGNKIVSWVVDIDFYKMIDKGEAIRKGDVLECVLEIKQQYEPSIAEYVNKSYKVIKVNNHHPRSEQQEII